MSVNIATWDRILRLVAGSTLLTWAIAGGPWWTYFGLALLATSAWKICPVYSLLRTGTKQPAQIPTRN